ncbi:UrcA family protein [Sphingopyxis sp.]|uniref:UrcA family protein n=1 Tax=Sphingopyxis sp. TaxID=1908224 RepID=UPI003D6D0623
MRPRYFHRIRSSPSGWGITKGSNSMRIFMALPLLLLGAAPVFSQPIVATAPAGEIEVVKVSYADLNLDSDVGLARLDSRLRAAARSVCDVRPEFESTVRKMSTRHCFRSALSRGREAGKEIIAAQRTGAPLTLASAIIISRR